MNEKPHKRDWINFKELRSRLKFADVLRLHRIQVEDGTAQYKGPCPLPGHRKAGNPNPFSANLEKGIFQCFGCRAKGNALEFAALMEGVDVKDGSALRKVAVKLQRRFFPDGASTRQKETEPELPIAEESPSPRVLVNPPLDFELKGLDSSHRFFAKQGLNPVTVLHFGLGFCSRGLLKDRIAIPLHDDEGRLVGYAGWLVDGSQISSTNPKILFPSSRERNGVTHEFRSSELVYNASRVKTPRDELIVVSGVENVWAVNQAGIPSVVGLLDDSASERQVETIARITKPGGRIVLLFSGEKESRLTARSLITQLSLRRFVRWEMLDGEREPVDLSPDQIKAALAG